MRRSGRFVRAAAAALTLTALALAASPPAAAQAAPPDDPFAWLEDVESERALAWAAYSSDREQRFR